MRFGNLRFSDGTPKMPKDITKKLIDAFEIAAKDPQYHKFILERFTMPFYLPPDKIVPFAMSEEKSYAIS